METEFSRGGSLPETEEKELTRKDAFSISGKLVTYHPFGEWLRIVCSYLKRKAEGENLKKKDDKLRVR